MAASLIRSGLATLVLAGFAAAGVIHVPQDYAALQEALDAAQPDDTVVVHGGTHQPIVVWKSLTLMGEGDAKVTWTGDPSLSTESPDLILLSGPGYGRVTIAGMRVVSPVPADYIAYGGDGIVGSGFSQLRVVACDIAGADIGIAEFAGQEGGRGIVVSVPLVVVKDSIVRGGASLPYDGSGDGPDGSVGIVAHTVVLLNSTVTGGEVRDCYVWSKLPVVCDEVYGSEGGIGVSCKMLFASADSTVQGGEGATLINVTDPDNWCTKPSGEPIVANQVVLLPESGAFWMGGKK